jgi:2-polyprenyl-3-methyl-5-hydroxy-6-metoxy-1,4-benzoquinol methylase
VYGTEFSDQLVEHGISLGINMQKGDLTTVDLEPSSFDVITSFEVLEHTYDVRNQVLKYQNLLRKNGVLYLTTPDFNSVVRKRVGANYNVINYPEHLTYFTKHTLNKLLTSSGFDKKYLHSHGISFTRLRQSRSNTRISKSDISNPDEEMRQKIEKSAMRRIAKKLINAALNLTGTGHSLKAFYCKR